jgi:hypothetical protein
MGMANSGLGLGVWRLNEIKTAKRQSLLGETGYLSAPRFAALEIERRQTAHFRTYLFGIVLLFSPCSHHG